MSDNTKLIAAIKNAENALTKALNTLKEIASELPKNKAFSRKPTNGDEPSWLTDFKSATNVYLKCDCEYCKSTRNQ